MQIIGFNNWILSQTNRNDMVGDFARDVKRDTKVPNDNASKDSWLSHLGHRNACQAAINAFEVAWTEYKNEF